jgi:FkbM family methyltransferase
MFTRIIKKSVKKLLGLAGLTVVRRTRYGVDPFSDIKRLASEWRWPLRVVFDVGANTGNTAARALDELPGSLVFSFEPHPIAFRKLIARISDAKLFRAFNIALSNEHQEERQMFEFGSSDLSSLISNGPFAARFIPKATTITVKCDTLDRFCAQNNISAIDVLKIDTEGFDLVVLEGAKEMLERGAIRFVYVEFTDLKPKNGTFGGALMPFDDLLRPLGFRFIASYNDLLITDGDLFSVSNALFARPPA